MIIVPLPEMAGPRQRLAAAVRYALVDMAYSELPDDVEIVENEQGMFEWRSSDRGSRVGRPQPTPELARLACLTSLNVRAAMERVHVALKGGKYIHPPSCYTREQYERACALLGVVRLPDSVCESYDAWFKAPGHDAETIVVGLLASERHAGMVAEERRQRQHFERDLELLPGFRSHGLSREQYEKTCSWIGADPAPEEQIMELKIKYFEQVEIADMVDLPLVLANWRATGIYRELDEGSQPRATVAVDMQDRAGTALWVSTSERPEELRTKVFGERTIYDNPWVRLTLVDIEPPDGRRFEYHVVRLPSVSGSSETDGDEVPRVA